MKEISVNARLALRRRERIRRWTTYGVAAIVLLSLLGACFGDDDADPIATQDDAGAAATVTIPAEDPTATPTDEADTTPTDGLEDPTATEDPPAPTEAQPTETPDAPTAEPTPPEPPEMPGDRAVDEQIGWLLSAINGSLPPDEEIEARLHPTVLEALPVSEFVALLGQLAAIAPWEFARYLGDPVELDGQAVIRSAAGDLLVVVGLEVEAPHRFMTLLLIPYESPTLRFDDFQDAEEWLAGIAPQVSFQVAEVVDGVCLPIHAVDPDESLAVASAYKLWILLDLVERITAGEISWEDRLALTEDLKSLPSGTMQWEADGATFDLQTYAAKMITLSDNTATDHLTSYLGREAVEARIAATGHGSPERNMPLLLTRELFYLKGAASEDEQTAYIEAGSEGRRAILSELDVDLTLVDMERLAIPFAIDSIEWFASASDLCDVMVELHEGGQGDETTRAVLAASSGIEFDAGVWRYIAHKNGVEAGVGSGAWLLERADGRVFSITAILNDPDAAGILLDPAPLVHATAGLLAELD